MMEFMLKLTAFNLFGTLSDDEGLINCGSAMPLINSMVDVITVATTGLPYPDRQPQLEVLQKNLYGRHC